MTSSHSLFQCSCAHRDLHPFPTRRSSDLSDTPRSDSAPGGTALLPGCRPRRRLRSRAVCPHAPSPAGGERSEEHTSELQSHVNLVCRLLLEKKNKKLFRVSLTCAAESIAA